MPDSDAFPSLADAIGAVDDVAKVVGKARAKDPMYIANRYTEGRF
jgi:hypothetical protein